MTRQSNKSRARYSEQPWAEAANPPARFVDLADPLTAISVEAHACLRFIDRGNVDVQALRELITNLINHSRRAQSVFEALQSGNSLRTDEDERNLDAQV
ncbi:hypothetical protein [Rhizobium leguminosarum]|uniref:hypothetical protein n=1 Tax=Rhizobium leguminosarum TaxID=384 RepID=UPI000FEC6315|nr:hypothetical protein [Rhizobium leguminosarum]RWX35222.1 hypothetical protein EHI43_11310 [Rhizobium leguminosarum]